MILFLKILVLMLSSSVLLTIQELKLYGSRNGVLRLEADKYKTRLCRLTAVVSQIRCNNYSSATGATLANCKTATLPKRRCFYFQMYDGLRP